MVARQIIGQNKSKHCLKERLIFTFGIHVVNAIIRVFTINIA